jgi:hypothetical protein
MEFRGKAHKICQARAGEQLPLGVAHKKKGCRLYCTAALTKGKEEALVHCNLRRKIMSAPHIAVYPTMPAALAWLLSNACASSSAVAAKY